LQALQIGAAHRNKATLAYSLSSSGFSHRPRGLTDTFQGAFETYVSLDGTDAGD
jgi:hypothetical protein